MISSGFVFLRAKLSIDEGFQSTYVLKTDYTANIGDYQGVVQG